MNKVIFRFVFFLSCLICAHAYADEVAYRKFLGAVKDKDLVRLNTILKSGFDLNAGYGPQHSKLTPLEIVISSQRKPNDLFTENVVKLLLENGANPELHGPLEMITRNGSTNLTEILLEKFKPSEKGANAYCSALSSTLILRRDYSKWNKKGEHNKDIELNTSIINLLLQKKWTQKFMSVASMESVMETLKYLSKKEVAIMAADGVQFDRLTYGIPAAFFALGNLRYMKKPEEIHNFLETLQAAKIDLKAKTESGLTMTMKAAQLDNPILLKELQRAQLLTHEKTKSGFTAIDYAAAVKQSENIQYLTTLGFKISPQVELFQIEQNPGYLLFGERQDPAKLGRNKDELFGPKIKTVFTLSLKPEATIGELNDFLKKNNLRIAMMTPLSELMIGEATPMPSSETERTKIIEISKSLKWIDKLEVSMKEKLGSGHQDTPKQVLVCDEDAKKVASYLKLAPLQNCKTTPVGPENLKLRLVQIKYGEGMDCPAGCIYNEKFAVVDASNKIVAAENPPRLLSLDPKTNNKKLLESILRIAHNADSYIVYTNRLGSYPSITEVDCQPQGLAGTYSPYLEIDKFNWEIDMGQDTVCTFRRFKHLTFEVEEGVEQVSGKARQVIDKQQTAYNFSKIKFKKLNSAKFRRVEAQSIEITASPNVGGQMPKPKNDTCLKNYPLPKITALKEPLWRPVESSEKGDILYLSVENFTEYNGAKFTTSFTPGDLSFSLWQSNTRLGIFEVTSAESLKRLPIVLNLKKESEVFLKIEDKTCEKVYTSQTVRF